MAHIIHHWWLPLIAATAWMVTLWTLLIYWLASGRPRYPSMQESIAYISDIAATKLKPLFIVGCVTTGLFFFLSLVADRWLRHQGRLDPNRQRREKVLSILAMIGAAIGSAGLILLSIFDTRRHPSIHRLFLLIFMVGVALSAIFTTAEYYILNRLDFSTTSSYLHASYVAKIVILIVEVNLSIIFGVFLEKTIDNPAAVLEWTISFVFVLYLITFAVDLYPAVGVEKGERTDMVNQMQYGQTNNGRPIRSSWVV